MKVLNIDTFVSVKRQLVVAGAHHDVQEVTVQTFINNLKAAEEMDAAAVEAGGQPELLSAQVGKSVDSICESVPSLSRDYLLGRPVEVLGAILKFIRGEMDPEVAGSDQGATEKKPG